MPQDIPKKKLLITGSLNNIPTIYDLKTEQKKKNSTNKKTKRDIQQKETTKKKKIKIQEQNKENMKTKIKKRKKKSNRINKKRN